MTRDLKVTDHGSVVQFFPLTDAGEAFLKNIHTEGWQWMGNSLVVDHRAARNVVEAIINEGLEL